MTGWVLLDHERLSSLEPDDAILDEAIAYARSKAKKRWLARRRNFGSRGPRFLDRS